MRPDKLPRWATSDLVSPVTGVNNVVEPPESKKNSGWNTYEPPARGWFNWLHRKTYEWLFYLDRVISEREKVTDGDGVKLFDRENVLISLYAVDKTTPANFIHAVGYRGTGAPTLNVIANNVLSLGANSTDGSQAITGGTASNVVVYGIMQS